jgi:hypothetical protein
MFDTLGVDPLPFWNRSAAPATKPLPEIVTGLDTPARIRFGNIPVTLNTVTVNEAGALVTPPNEAVTLLLPAPTPVAMLPDMVATAVFELAQMALPVRFCVLASL